MGISRKAERFHTLLYLGGKRYSVLGRVLEV